MPLLDARQILQKVLNEAEDRLRVEVNATVTAGAIEVAIDQTTDSIKVGDGVNLLQVNPDGSINVVGTIEGTSDVNIHDGSSNPLTSQVSGSQRALDVGINVAGVQIDPRVIRLLTAADIVTVVQPTGTNLHVSVDNFPATQPVSGTVAATQSGVWSVGRTWTLASGTDSVAAAQSGSWTTGRTWALAGGTDTVTANAGTGTFQTNVTNATLAVTQSGTWTVQQGTPPWTFSLPTGASTSALQTTGNASLSSIDGKLNSLGQKTMANSVPVVVASDQSALSVVGNVASAATDSGNPVKVGAIYNSTLPTFTNGQRADLQANLMGELAVRSRHRTTRITGNTTTVVKSGTGVFAGIAWGQVNGSASVTVYDNTAGSGTVIWDISPGSNALNGTIARMDREVTTGITVVTSGLLTLDITILWQ